MSDIEMECPFSELDAGDWFETEGELCVKTPGRKALIIGPYSFLRLGKSEMVKPVEVMITTVGE